MVEAAVKAKEAKAKHRARVSVSARAVRKAPASEAVCTTGLQPFQCTRKG